MKRIFLVIFILLSACTQTPPQSEPMGQLEIYGIQKITKHQLERRLLENICAEVGCQVFLSSQYPNGGKKDIGRVKFKNKSSFIFDFLPDGTTGFLYVKENVESDDQESTEFIQKIEDFFGPTLFFNVKTWNCYPAKDSCGTKERKLTVPVPFSEALSKAKESP